MDEKRYFEYDLVSIDAAKIEERTDPIHGSMTVFKDVVISREIVHVYPDGVAYKPGNELKDAAWTAEGMWAIAGGHPRDAIIMDRDEIQGRTVNARFSKSLIDPKTQRPNNKGIVVDLEVFNNKVSPETLDDMKNGRRRDVSIGFFFHRDETPGIISEDGHPLKGSAYDFVQRKMTINHTAFALEAGRCPMPFCGVGADEIGKHITGDPFAGFPNFEACIQAQMKRDPDLTREQAAGTCGLIEKRSKAKKDMFKTVLENMKNEIDAVLSKFDELEELKKDDGETIVDETMSDQEDLDLSGLLAFFRLTQKSWDGLLDETRIILASRWTDLKKYYKDGELEKMSGGELTPVDSVLQQDESETDCPDCEEEDEHKCPEGQVWNTEHNKCVSADEEDEDEDEETVTKVPFKATKSIEELLNRQ